MSCSFSVPSPIFSEMNRALSLAYIWALLTRISFTVPFSTSIFSLTWQKSTIRKIRVSYIDILLERYFLWIINGPERWSQFFWFPLSRTVQHLVWISMGKGQFRFPQLSKLWITKQEADPLSSQPPVVYKRKTKEKMF